MNLKRLFSVGVALVCLASPAAAGGLLTNTNLHVAFLRMMARGASTDTDAAYSNPAGLAYFNKEGFTLSFNWQNAYQTRNIDATYPLFPEANHNRYYKGTASAPVIPSLFAVYKKNDWTFSGFAGVIGGGGKASFDQGLPMFDSQVMAGLASNTLIQGVQQMTGAQAATDLYNIATAMEGRQYIYGVQAGATYRATEWLSVYAGARMNFFSGGYTGYLTATAKPELLQHPAVQAAIKQNPALGALATNPLYDLRLDVNQNGWGIAPVLGVNIKKDRLTLAAKYEFMTNLNIENDTKENTDPEGALKDFKDGVNTPNDIPALLSTAIGYEFLPTLRATAEYHHFYDGQAGMAGGKQKTLKHGTDEFLFGVEWDAIKQLTLSAGYQRTNYGQTDDYQQDTSFSCDSYSIGFGGAWKPNQKIKVNFGYFWTTYSDYTKAVADYNKTTLPGTNIYSRTNKVLGVGLDYTF